MYALHIRLALTTISGDHINVAFIHTAFIDSSFLVGGPPVFKCKCVAHLMEAVPGGIRSYLGEGQQQGDWHCCATQNPVTCLICP